MASLRKRRMRVLFVVNANRDTGIFVFAKSLAVSLRKKGIDVQIDKFSGKYDLIHFQNPMPSSYVNVKRHYPLVPMLCTTNMTHSELQGIMPRPLLGVAENYLYLFYLSCRKIICSSPKITNELKEMPVISKRLIYLPNGVDLRHLKKDPAKGLAFRKKHGIGKGKKVVLCVATIQKRKGIFDFVKAAGRMKDYAFVWVGGVPELPTLENGDELRRLFCKKHENLIFTGFLERKELSSAYSAADVFLFPTHAETFGLVAVEAASMGLPVIIRDLPEFRMFSSFAIKFRDERQIDSKLKKVLENRGEWKEYSSKGIEAAKKFDLDKYADKTVKIYEDIIYW